MEASCFECGRPAAHDHHVIPHSLGGTRTVPLCGDCHGKVHDHAGLRADRVGELSRLALAKKRARGEVSGTPPYGYAVGEDGCTLWTPDARPVSQIVYRMGRRLGRRGRQDNHLWRYAELAPRGMEEVQEGPVYRRGPSKGTRGRAR